MLDNPSQPMSEEPLVAFGFEETADAYDQDWGFVCPICRAEERKAAEARDRAERAHDKASQRFAAARTYMITAATPTRMWRALSHLNKLKPVVRGLRTRWLLAEDELYRARDQTVMCLIYYGIGPDYHAR